MIYPHPPLILLLVILISPQGGVALSPSKGISRASAAVVACRGSFPVRASACDPSTVTANQAYIVPIETMNCSNVMTPSDFAQWLSNSTNSLSRIPVGPTQVQVSFGDCTNPSALPNLVGGGTNYVVLIVLNNAAAAQSALMKTANGDSPDILTVKSSVYYIDFALLPSTSFISKIMTVFKMCGRQMCKLTYDSSLISKPAVTELRNYLG